MGPQQYASTESAIELGGMNVSRDCEGLHSWRHIVSYNLSMLSRVIIPLPGRIIQMASRPPSWGFVSAHLDTTQSEPRPGGI
jgi:hypothetical protein